VLLIVSLYVIYYLQGKEVVQKGGARYINYQDTFLWRMTVNSGGAPAPGASLLPTPWM